MLPSGGGAGGCQAPPPPKKPVPVQPVQNVQPAPRVTSSCIVLETSRAAGLTRDVLRALGCDQMTRLGLELFTTNTRAREGTGSREQEPGDGSSPQTSSPTSNLHLLTGASPG